MNANAQQRARRRTITTDELGDAIRACRIILGGALIFGSSVNILYLAPSIYMMQVYDRVLQSGSVATLFFLSIALVMSIATLTALDGLRSALMARVGLRLDELLGRRLLGIALSGKADAKRHQIVREFDTLRQTVTGPAALALMDAPWCPVYVLICSLLHPWLGVLTAAGGAVLVLVAIVNERAQRRVLAAANEAAPRTYAVQEGDAASGELIRALGMNGNILNRQIAARSSLLTLQSKGVFVGLQHSSVTKFVRLCLQSMSLGLAAYLAIEHKISTGSIAAVSILTSRALGPLEQIVGAWRQIGSARLAYKSISEALADEPAPGARTVLPRPSGALRVERVTVRVTNDERLALREVSFEAQPGEIVGIIGPSGAGKSTLCRALVGAIAPDVGHVRIDGASLRDWDRDELGRHLGYAPQDIGLLSGTIGENIRRFDSVPTQKEAIDEATIAAAKAVGAHDMIMRLPLAYETQLGPGGRGLSHGQSQRIALARAWYREPHIYVLDEPNAYLDADGEQMLASALRAAQMRGSIVMLTAHRMGILNLADRLLVLRDGRVERFGPRDDVMAWLRSNDPGKGPSTQSNTQVSA